MKAANNLVILCIFTLCGFGLHQSLNFGVASFQNYSVLNMLENWRNSPSVHNVNDYAQIKLKAQQNVQFHALRAEYWLVLGQVNEWGYVLGYETHEDALLDVKKQYLRATELRPLWPDAWASLIKLKWRLQEFDSEMLFFIERATKLGPQKPDVHMVMIELGMALYANNHIMLLDIREEFHRRLALGLKHPKTRGAVRRLISEYNLQTVVCRWMKNEDRKTRRRIPKCK